VGGFGVGFAPDPAAAEIVQDQINILIGAIGDDRGRPAGSTHTELPRNTMATQSCAVRFVPRLGTFRTVAPFHNLSRRCAAIQREGMMAKNKPVGDNARKGAVKKRTQRKTAVMGKPAWTKRDKTSGEFMAVKKSAKKFKGVRREKA